jgi:hypothetical protein
VAATGIPQINLPQTLSNAHAYISNPVTGWSCAKLGFVRGPVSVLSSRGVVLATGEGGAVHISRA